jgi:hypothetical protein
MLRLTIKNCLPLPVAMKCGFNTIILLNDNGMPDIISPQATYKKIKS